MNKAMKDRKAKAGLLLVASPRFKNLSGPKRGTYGERKDKAVKEIMASLDFLDLVWPGAKISPGSASSGTCRRFRSCSPMSPGTG